MTVATYPIVTICGSMRFYPAMLKAAEHLTHNGFIVLMPFVTTAQGSEPKVMLDDMHKRKILLSNAVVFITNRDYYYGSSTRSE